MCCFFSVRVEGNGTSTRRIATLRRGSELSEGENTRWSELCLAMKLMEFYDKFLLNFNEICSMLSMLNWNEMNETPRVDVYSSKVSFSFRMINLLSLLLF